MKKNLLTNMLAAIAALFTLMFALPQKAMAENYVTIDYQHERTKPSAGTLTMGTVTATSYTIKGLEPETEYEVEINAYDESGNYKRYGVQTVTTKKATATKYGITIAGVEITADNYTDISASNGFPAVKSGTVSYNPENRTLTLDNVVIETRNGIAVWFYDEEITHAYTLVLKGNGNRLTSASAATLATRSNLTITGGSSAQITSKGDCGIFVNTDATLTITGGCSITAEGKWGIAGNNGESETLIIDGATVKAKGNGTEGSICDLQKIQLKNCAITAPSGATVERGSVKLGGKVVTDWVTIEPVTTESYGIKIGGVDITADNCADISASNGFTGVKSGTVGYDHSTKTLTLDNATIHAIGKEVSGIYNQMDGLTINLIGSSTITSDEYIGILNIAPLTIKGKGSLKVNGATTAGNTYNRHGIVNNNKITVKDCTIDASGGSTGIAAGYWTFDNCTVRTKGGGSSDNPYIGSLCWMGKKQPIFIGCSITAPEGAYWKEFEEDGDTYYSLFGADNKVVTDWVTIEPTGTGIDTPTGDVPARKQGVYNLQGVRLGTSLERLPKGIYIVDGRKVVKK